MALHKVVRRFFPLLRSRLSSVADFRNPALCTYPIRHLLWAGILLFVYQLGSLRRLRFDLASPAGIANLDGLAGTDVG